MPPNNNAHSELLEMVDESLMTEEQRKRARYLEKAENDPVLQAEISEDLRKRGTKTEDGPDGIYVLQKGHYEPEHIIRYCRDALALGVLNSIPKEEWN